MRAHALRAARAALSIKSSRPAVFWVSRGVGEMSWCGTCTADLGMVLLGGCSLLKAPHATVGGFVCERSAGMWPRSESDGVYVLGMGFWCFWMLSAAAAGPRQTTYTKSTGT